MKLSRLALAFSVVVHCLAAIASNVTERNPILMWGSPTGDYRKVGDFLLAFDGRTRTARWSLEYLTKQSLTGDTPRSFDFHVDAECPVEFRPLASDYEGSGYDIGHMAPAADFPATKESMKATFTLSNAAPQVGRSNRGPWARLEASIRKRIADGSDRRCWVVTAPLWIHPGAGKTMLVKAIGDRRVWVPTHVGKAILRERKDGTRELACFIVPNDVVDIEWESCHVSGDVFESAAGFDVFSGLPDDEEDRLESL